MNVIIMRGIPGSGKSTYVKENFPGAVICSADHHFIQPDGSYVWKREEIGEAHKACQEKFKLAVNRKEPLIVVDNTNIRTKDYQFYVDYGIKQGYAVRTCTISCDVETAFARNVHGVPKETIQRMYDSLRGVKNEI